MNWTSVREDGKVGAVKTAVFLARVLCSFGQVEIDGIDILIELYLLSKVPDKINFYYPGYFCSPVHQKPAFLFYTPEVYHGNLENQPLEKDLVTYSTLAEPVMRSRRCFGDTGVWSYCVLVEVMVSVVILLMFQKSQTTTWYV